MPCFATRFSVKALEIGTEEWSADVSDGEFLVECLTIRTEMQILKLGVPLVEVSVSGRQHMSWLDEWSASSDG